MFTSNAGLLATEYVRDAARLWPERNVRHGVLLWNTAKVTINTLHLRQHEQHYSTLTKSNREDDGMLTHELKDYVVYRNDRTGKLYQVHKEGWADWKEMGVNTSLTMLVNNVTQNEARQFCQLTREE